MSYLVDLHQTIQPSLSSSLPFFLLAIAYHSSFPHLLYALYGQTPADPLNPVNPYQNYFLLTHDSRTNSLISNITLPAFCPRECRIKATASLFLLQTDARIVLYAMQADQNTVDTSLPLLNQTKRYNTSDSFQYQWADVSGSQFLYSDGTNIYFIRRTGTVPTSIYFALPNPTVIISASITESFALLTIKNPGLQVMLINCVPCIFSYSYTSGTTMSSSMYKIVNLPGSPTKWYRVTRADPEFQSGSLTSLWILDDGNAKYLTVDLVSLATTELNAMNLGSNAFMVSNNQVVLFANRTTQLLQANYAIPPSSINMLELPNSTIVAITAISNDSQRIAVQEDSAVPTIKLYTFASSCANFQAQLQNDTCVCLEYLDGACKSKLSGDAIKESGKGMPAYGVAVLVILSAMGAALVVFSLYLSWKCWQKTSKVSRRKSWKYNPRQFMSLEV